MLIRTLLERGKRVPPAGRVHPLGPLRGPDLRRGASRNLQARVEAGAGFAQARAMRRT